MTKVLEEEGFTIYQKILSLRKCCLLNKGLNNLNVIIFINRKNNLEQLKINKQKEMNSRKYII